MVLLRVHRRFSIPPMAYQTRQSCTHKAMKDRMRTVNHSEAILLASLNNLDADTLVVLLGVTDNPNVQHVAVRLRKWLSTELKSALERLEAEEDGIPKPMAMHLWSNADVGDALVVASAMNQAAVTERQSEFILKLWQTVSVHSAARLKYNQEFEKKVAPWN